MQAATSDIAGDQKSSYNTFRELSFCAKDAEDLCLAMLLLLLAGCVRACSSVVGYRAWHFHSWPAVKHLSWPTLSIIITGILGRVSSLSSRPTTVAANDRRAIQARSRLVDTFESKLRS